jgi:predicted enzyme related to lactoylglutathione lyase
MPEAADSNTVTDAATLDADTVSSVRLCIDANDVDLVARFWVSLFGYRVREGADTSDTWRHLDASSPALPALTIQPVGEAKTVKDRLHLDFFVTEPDPWIERAVRCGAAKLALSEEPDDWFQVMADPEGNEFCICLAGPVVS